MTFETFEKIILKLQLALKRDREIYRLGVEMTQVTDEYHFIIDTLLREAFNDDQIGWIDWYLYERPSLTGKGKPNKAYKTVGKKKVEICHTIDSLWETIQEYTPQAEWDKRWPGRNTIL